MTETKIVTLEEMAAMTRNARKRGQTIVHCHGVFDLLHIGHIRYFQQAKKMGDMLVVTITPDEYVNKGPGRPAFSEDLRVEAVAFLDVVDYVAKNRWPMADETIKLVKPHVYAKGIDYKDEDKDITGGITKEREAIESIGGSLVFTDDIVFSSSSLINKYASVYPKDMSDYLAEFASRYATEEIIAYLKNALSLKVLTIGETIIDEYQYCDAIGKSSKEPVLAIKNINTERFAGGILAVANHVSSFCNKVGLLTFLGDENSEEDFIHSKMNPDIDTMFLTRKNSPTIIKRRLIEKYFFLKMVEIYTINDAELCESDNKTLLEKLEKIVPLYDLVIVVDFGHSMMTKEAVNIVTSKAKYLAVNAQANAGNMGFNVISKYPRADYITMAEKELRLEARDQSGDLKEMIEHVSNKMNCNKIIVTRGTKGSLCYSREEGFIHIPAFSHGVVDRVGAGDALLSISSLCAVQDAPMEVIGFIGNAVGAWSVGTVCNKEPIKMDILCKQIETMLK
ncbi:MAG: adenylyltransferase/cytidyltransferase family protein [Proteobacteria bacterium]|nr:adenylyltransferase/cytidyltransferase family protein [Pseudomonadota bacterium]